MSTPSEANRSATTPAEFDLYLRIPGWSQDNASPDALYQSAGRSAASRMTLKVNGHAVGTWEMVRGYARLRRQWIAGDVVELSLDMPVQQTKAHSAVQADDGLVALMRGPCSTASKPWTTRKASGIWWFRRTPPSRPNSDRSCSAA